MSEEKIDDSCPSDLKPYEKVREIRFKEQDEIAYLQGVYFTYAIATCLDKETPYPKKPLYSEFGSNKSETAELTEEEKRKQIEALFMQLSVMGGNFNRTHGDKNGGDN